MTKVVINRCFGGFGLSKEAVLRAQELAPENSAWQDVDLEFGFIYGIERHNEVLVKVVEELGNSASGFCAKLEVVDIDSNLYRIDEYDGMESVETPDDVEWIVVK